MMKNIIGQSVYLTVVLFIVLLAGESLIPEDCSITERRKLPNHSVNK